MYGSSAMNDRNARVGKKPCRKPRNAGLLASSPSAKGSTLLSLSMVVHAEMAATGAAQKKVRKKRPMPASTRRRPRCASLEAAVGQ